MANQETLFFKDNFSAFEYACKFTSTELIVDQNALGIVIDCIVGAEGNDMYVVHLSDFGSTLASAVALHPRLEIKKGDLVSFRLKKVMQEMPKPFNNVGVIGAKFLPEWSLKRGWKLMDIEGLYEKPNIFERILNLFR
jgi:hypothetical protein